METNKLHHIKSTTSFKTPPDYFNTLDETIFSKLKNNTALSKIDKTGFKAPKNYFNTLDDSILKKIENATKVIPLFGKKTIWITSSIAATVVLLLSLPIFDNKPSFHDLDTQSVENYLLNENMSTSEIASLFSDEELDINIFEDQNIGDNQIEDYLINYTDIETLITE